jgi:spore coat polysaccharide biosynthesis protein SpsF
VQVYRGSEHDVLARYFEAAKEVAADTIVRVTADCPVIDPEIIDAAIERFQSGNDTHYLSNTQVRSYPRGMDVEVFSFDALREAQQLATKQEEREHVTPFIYKHPERYHMQDLVQSEDESYWRWTVDTPDDYLLIQEMIQDLYPQHPRFAIADMRAFMKKHPNLAEINSHVEQKKLSC